MSGKKRMLMNGVFVPFKEDREESERQLKLAGNTREEMEAERRIKRSNKLSGKSLEIPKMSLSDFSDELIEAEMKKRVAAKEYAAAQELREKEENPLEPGGVKVTEEDFSAYTVNELKGLLDDKGIIYGPNSKKDKLIELLEKDGKVGEEDL